MSTKNNPGPFDCYAKLDNEEPYFLLRAKDPSAPFLIELWRFLRSDTNLPVTIATVFARVGLIKSDKPKLPLDSSKSLEAHQCAEDMVSWIKLKGADGDPRVNGVLQAWDMFKKALQDMCSDQPKSS